jgi:hypothetical protein
VKILHKLTHLDFASVIRSAVSEQIDVELNRRGFIYGNIKPDIIPSYFLIPHFKKPKTMEFLKAEIAELTKYKLQKHQKCSREFSERLGIVTHYLSDFFCYVHSQHSNCGVLSHYIYEVKLWLFCRKHCTSIKTLDYSRYIEITPNTDSIYTLIENLQKKYLSKSPSYALDVVYSLRMCISLCVLTIKACLNEEIKEIAA